MPAQLLATTDAVAIGVTVVATLVVVALALALAHLLRSVRELRRQAEALAREAGELLSEMRADLRQAGAEVERVERMVGSAEAISDAVGGASRVMGRIVAAPFIKTVAFAAGVGQAARSLRGVGRQRVPRHPVPVQASRRRSAAGGRRLRRGGGRSSRALPAGSRPEVR